MSERPPTKRARLFKLASMTAKVAGKSAGRKMSGLFGHGRSEEAKSEHYAWTGEQIAQTLGELKGAAMKVGQMAAATWDLMPSEMSDALRVLQNDVPPAPYAQIAEQIEQELGAPPEQLFAHIERNPIGTASIGQVHRARLKSGQQVVVKVQYPGIDEAVDSDLAQLKTLAKLKAGFLDKEALDQTFEEIRDRMVEELDYGREAQRCQEFGERFADDPLLVVPQLQAEFSAKKVITTSFEPSDPLDRLCELGYSQSLRDQIATRLFSLLWEQIFVHRSLHADPHPGNFGARPDGSFVIYDFGCIKEIPEAFVKHYRELICAAFVEDYERVEQALRGLGVRRLKVEHVPPEYYRAWRNLGLKPFADHPLYDFGQSEIHKGVIKKIPDAIKYVSAFKPAPDLVFVDRTLVGHYGNLRALKGKVHCFEILAEHLPEIRNAPERRA